MLFVKLSISVTTGVRLHVNYNDFIHEMEFLLNFSKSSVLSLLYSSKFHKCQKYAMNVISIILDTEIIFTQSLIIQILKRLFRKNMLLEFRTSKGQTECL